MAEFVRTRKYYLDDRKQHGMNLLKDFFPHLTLSQRVLQILESKKDFGGPQTIDDLCKNFKISNGSSRSVLVRLHKAGKIERISKGTYRIKGDIREHSDAKQYLI